MAPGILVASRPGTPEPFYHRQLTSKSVPSSQGPSQPLVAVIGCGFVGTGLIGRFSARYHVLGYDISEKRITEATHEFVANKNVAFTSREAELSRASVFLISVPTLLRDDKSVDLSYIQKAIETIKKHAKPGSTIVIESSVAVGQTRQLLGPILRSHRLFGGMSPERIDPGRIEPPMHAIPKVVSGLDDIAPGSLQVISRIYSRAFDQLVPVSCPEVAEMTKLYENCQRMMCIAYANEMADACRSLGIDAFEVSKAAATKPFGYLPCYPSLGVGGHCIPVNPHYLLSTSEFPLLKEATASMDRRPSEIGERIIDSLALKKGNEKALSSTNSVLVVGVGFKAGQSHLVNSPGMELALHLRKRGIQVMFADPLVPQESLPEVRRMEDAAWNEEGLKGFGAIVVCFKQCGFPLEVLDQLYDVDVQRWFSLQRLFLHNQNLMYPNVIS